MIAEIPRVLRLPNPKFSTVFFEQNGTISEFAIARRFGGWRAALKAAMEQLDPVGEASLLGRLADYTAPDEGTAYNDSKGTVASASADADDEPEEAMGLGGGQPSPPVVTTNVYGDFINFRGLQHAPVNEQGVVFLFGMVCREPGYVVEIVRSGFPDCEAKRRIAGKPGQWQRVRIEFEFEARSFRKHRHDPDECDVIVCWEDNWPECPIEVLELKTAIRSLPSVV